MEKEYYEAYEDRYQDVYKKNILWETQKPSKDVINIIKEYGITKDDNILELGCGEGRDTIYLLNNGYHNLLGVDYSKTVINKCNELTNNRYINNFKRFDIMTNILNKKYKFIYSVAVIHMFILSKHRNKFYKFIYDHLEIGGLALIVSMGSGVETYCSNLNDAFKKVKRKNINTNEEIIVTNTSCCIVDLNTLKKEIRDNNLEIIKTWISKGIPGFDKCICAVVKRN